MCELLHFSKEEYTMYLAFFEFSWKINWYIAFYTFGLASFKNDEYACYKWYIISCLLFHWYLWYQLTSSFQETLCMMAAGCKLRLSVNICIFLCIYVSFVNYKSLYLQKSTSLNVSDVYFVSKVSCRTEIAGNLRQQRNPSGIKELSNLLKAVIAL